MLARTHPPRRRLSTLLGWLVIAMLCAACGPAADAPATAVPVTTITNIGSDTMVNLALAWAETYAGAQSGVRLSVTGGGSGTGLAALVNNTVDIANASRAIKDDERAKAETNGLTPVEYVVARDAIAIIIHPDNPVDHLSLEQLSAMYRGQITNWREVGGQDRPIVLLSRETNSGTHVYFLEHVVRLGKADKSILFTPDVLLMPSSEGISAEVRQNPNAIGYDGLGYVTPDMKTVAVSAGPDKPYVLPSIATVNDKSYPISRDLYMYARQGANPAVAAYLAWIVSPPAQEIVAKLGFVPILTSAP